jgi:hypothetical protein
VTPAPAPRTRRVAAGTRRVTTAALAVPVLLLLATLVGCGAGSPAAATTHHTLPSLVDARCIHPGQARPATIVLACGDGNAVAEHVRWQTWATTRAAGEGTLSQNDCTPDCAQGGFHGYPARFALSDTVRAGGRTYFTKVTITFAGRRPLSATKKVEVVSDCFVNPPEAYIPKCPPDLSPAP